MTTLFAEIQAPHGIVLIHTDSPLGDGRTLCGLALEGGGGSEFRVHSLGRITCGTCWRIIAHCKAIPSKDVAYPVGRPNKPSKEQS